MRLLTGWLRRARLAVVYSCFTCCFVFALAAGAADKKADVPFPDVWCRMPPLSGMGWEPPVSLSAIYFDAQNHPVAAYTLPLPGKQKMVRFYDFFKDQVLDEYLFQEETDEADKARHQRRQSIFRRYGLRLAETVLRTMGQTSWIDNKGKRVYRESLVRSHGSNMYPLDAGLKKIDDTGQVVFDVMLVHKSLGVRKLRNPWPENSFWEGQKHSLIRTNSISPIVYDLQDGTYLLTGFNWPGMLRFRGALESPCLDPVVNTITGEVWAEYMAVDAEWARNLYEEAVEYAHDLRDQGKSLRLAVSVADGYVTKKLQEKLEASVR